MSRANCKATFERANPGHTAKWVARMNERYGHGELLGVGMLNVIARDTNE